jgi:hypothetical protein
MANRIMSCTWWLPNLQHYQPVRGINMYYSALVPLAMVNNVIRRAAVKRNINARTIIGHAPLLHIVHGQAIRIF